MTVLASANLETGNLSEFTTTSIPSGYTFAAQAGSALNGSFGLRAVGTATGNVNATLYGRFTYTTPATNVTVLEFAIRPTSVAATAQVAANKAVAAIVAGTNMNNRMVWLTMSQQNTSALRLQMGYRTKSGVDTLNGSTLSISPNTWRYLRLVLDKTGANPVISWHHSTDRINWTQVASVTDASAGSGGLGGSPSTAWFGIVHINNFSNTNHALDFDDIEVRDVVATTDPPPSTRPDTGTVTGTEGRSLAITATRPDTGTVTGTAGRSLALASTQADTGTVLATETATVIARPATVDTGTVVATESAEAGPPAAGITIRDQGEYVSGGADTSHTVPSAGMDVVDGDIIEFTAAYRMSAVSGVNDVTWPSGFVELPSSDLVNSRGVGRAWKRASGESGDYAIGLSESSQLAVWWRVIAGALASGDPVNAHDVSDSPASGNPQIPPQLVTSVDGCLVTYATVLAAGVTNNWTVPAGVTEDAESASTGSSNVALLSARETVNPDAGTVPERQFTTANTGTTIPWLATAYAPAVAGPTPITDDDTATVTGSEGRTLASASTRPDTGTVTATETTALLRASTRTDTGTLAGTETAALAAAASRSDTAPVVAAETASVVVRPSAADTATLTATEGRSGAATIARPDTATVAATDTGVVAETRAVITADTGTLAGTEQAALAAAITRPETGAITGEATTAILEHLAVTASDTGSVTGAGVVALAAVLTTTDTALVTGTAAGELGGAEDVSASDTGAVVATESASVVVRLATAETASLAPVEAIAGDITTQAADTATVAGAEQAAPHARPQAADTATVTGQTTASTSAAVSTTDSGALTAMEQVALAVAMTRADTGTVTGTAEGSLGGETPISTADTGAVVVMETSSLLVALVRDQSAPLVLLELAGLLADLERAETGSIDALESTLTGLSASDTGSLASLENVALRAAYARTEALTLLASETVALSAQLTAVEAWLLAVAEGHIPAVRLATMDVATLVAIASGAVEDVTPVFTGEYAVAVVLGKRGPLALPVTRREAPAVVEGRRRGPVARLEAVREL